MSTSDPVDVVIVGGGIGGLASALALARAGQRVRVLEQASRFGEVGAGLQMAPNATRILRQWGVLGDVMASGVLPDRLVMRDALDGSILTYLDVAHARKRYQAPYVVLHRTDLHSILLDACRGAGVDLVTACHVEDVEQAEGVATAVSHDRRDSGAVVVAADGLGSSFRRLVSDDEPVSSQFVAYRGAVPMETVAGQDGIDISDVVVYVGPGRHFVQYGLRHGEMFNQVAVFRSPKAVAGEDEWGTPDELDDAFAGSCKAIRDGLPHLWRDRWWNMYDREPIDTWVHHRLLLTGDSAHPMLQYLAQGACQAIEDAAELGNLSKQYTTGGTADWDTILGEYEKARIERAGRVQVLARAWGDFWHCAGEERRRRNALLRARDPHDYRHIDWFYGAQ